MRGENLNNTTLPSPAEANPAHAHAGPSDAKGQAGIRELDLRDVMGDAREIVLVHNGEPYRLRITARGKLILTK
jgi:hemin uptake protein HemP